MPDKFIRLWLDDKRPMPTDYDVHVSTYKEAIEHIKTGKVSHIGFDHDLGDEENPDIRNGYQVAAYVERCAFYGSIPKLTWSIQSDNGPGRLRIAAAMGNADKFWDAI